MTYRNTRDYLTGRNELLEDLPWKRLPPVSFRALHEGIAPGDARITGVKAIDTRTGKVTAYSAEGVRAAQRYIDAAMAPIRDRMERHYADALRYGVSAFYMDRNGAVRSIGLASRYWPAETEDHQHMHDLTLSPAPKGGYVVTNYDDDVVYAGKLDDCTTFMAEQMEELEDKRADEEAAESAKRRAAEAERLLALEADRIRSEAEKQIAALHIVPAVTAGGGQ